jgi:hypothetical protein
MNEPPSWLRAALREEADSHEPDRQRMRARVDAGTRPRRVRRPAGRPLAAAVLAATGVAVVAVGVTALRSDRPAAPALPAGDGWERTARPSPSVPSPGARTALVAPPPPTARPAPSSAAPSTSGRRRTPAAASIVAELDPGSNDYWAQADVTVSAERALTDLQVTVRVARTRGVRSTASWSSLPGDAYVSTVGDEAGELVYRWVLRPGRSVPPGHHVFAAQYVRDPGGHDTHGDTYTVTGSDAHGRRIEDSGRF